MGLSRGNLTKQRLERKEIFETHDGSRYDSIPYNGNVTLENGKHYSQDTVNPVYNPLRELVGLYVEMV